MTKTELIETIAKEADLHKADVGKGLNTFIDVIGKTLAKGENVTLPGFGTFEVRQRAAREGVNPATKEAIKIPAKTVPGFKAGKTLKDTVAK